MLAILRATRSSAAHLATAQRHAGAAARLRRDAALSRMRAGKLETPESAALAREASRLEGLARRAMARHESARALLD